MICVIKNFIKKINRSREGFLKDTGGYTPAQYALGFVVLASLTFAAINSFESSSATADQKTVADDLDSIWSNMDTHYFKGYPSGVFTTDIRGHLPEFMQGPSNTVRNKYGASVLFEGITVSSLIAAQVTYPGVPKATCENILLRTPIGNKSRFYSVSVNGGTALTASVTTDAAAQTACSASRNSFVFVRFSG